MGTQAEILCVGKYKKCINSFMEYPNDYDDVPEGTIVENTIMRCESTHASRELAERLNVEIGNPVTYIIKHENVIWSSFNDDIPYWLYDDTDGVPALEAFLKAGFICIFSPNY
jgi:hypothetical protein